jgi:hypothetical protein
MTVSGEARPSFGGAPGWHDWVDPADHGICRSEPVWLQSS